MTGPRTFAAMIAAVVAALALAWACLVLVTGGVDVTLLSLHLTSHDPRRAIFAAAIALSAYMLIADRDRMRVVALPIRADVLALAMAVTLSVVGIMKGTNAAGGSDTYGYVSQADMFLAGHLSVPQPWAKDVPWPDALSTFNPVAYRPTAEQWTVTPPIPHAPRDKWRIVPTYPPGLSLLMAAFKVVGGQAAMFWVAPIAGGLLVFATFAIGRRLGSAGAGLMAAWLVATSANVLQMTLAPMSDVPVAAAWAVMFWALLGRTMASGVVAALAGGLAILIRPNLVFAAIAILLLVIQQAWTAPASERRRRMWRGVVVMSGLAAGVAVVASLNWIANGSPFMSGYGTLREVMDWSFFVPNFRTYPRWFVDAFTPIGLLGVVALVVPLRWIWRDTAPATIWCLAVFVAGIWIEYFLWDVFRDKGYLRFLLASWPFLLLGLSNALLAPGRAFPKAGPWLSFAAVIVVLWLGLRGLMQAEALSVFEQRRGESRFQTAAVEVQRVTPENSVIYSWTHSGTVRYYAGRVTLRFDILSPDWLSRSVEYLSSHGAHPYLLLDDFEREHFEQQFPGDATVSLAARPPIFRFRGVALYDLAPEPGAHAETIVLPETAAILSVVQPAPAPTLVVRKP